MEEMKLAEARGDFQYDPKNVMPAIEEELDINPFVTGTTSQIVAQIKEVSNFETFSMAITHAKRSETFYEDNHLRNFKST